MTVTLDARKAAILRAVVTEYIETAQPVGSSHVCRDPRIRVSAATIRNEMSTLEQEGFLSQPHTSAGRIPTDKGYRFFVDHLSGGTLGLVQREQVRVFFSRTHGELEKMLEDTSRLLVEVTDYAAVVVGPEPDAATVRAVQLVGLSLTLALLVAVLSNGTVEKCSVELGEETPDDLLTSATAHLSRHLVGKRWGYPVRVPSTGNAATDAVVSAALKVLRKSPSSGEPESVFVDGASRMAEAFDGVETVRKVLSILEQQYMVVSLLRDVLDRGMSVAIGTEHGVVPLAECAVVVAPYIAGQRATGTIGVLGPTRMNYSQALAAVALVSQRLGRSLSEG